MISSFLNNRNSLNHDWFLISFVSFLYVCFVLFFVFCFLVCLQFCLIFGFVCLLGCLFVLFCFCTDSESDTKPSRHCSPIFQYINQCIFPTAIEGKQYAESNTPARKTDKQSNGQKEKERMLNNNNNHQPGKRKRKQTNKNKQKRGIIDFKK